VAGPRDRRRSIPGRAAGEIEELVHYWGTDYDWRKAEARLNALPQLLNRTAFTPHRLASASGIGNPKDRRLPVEDPSQGESIRALRQS
jgi:hypothetical protein